VKERVDNTLLDLLTGNGHNGKNFRDLLAAGALENNKVEFDVPETKPRATTVPLTTSDRTISMSILDFVPG
jgi:hypothetical protein